MGPLIGFRLDYAPETVVYRIQVWIARRLYVCDDVIIDIITHPFLGRLGLMRRCKSYCYVPPFAHFFYIRPHDPLQYRLVVGNIKMTLLDAST